MDIVITSYSIHYTKLYEVEKLNPLFQEDHLETELNLIQNKILGSQKEKEMYNKKQIEFSEKLQKAINAVVRQFGPYLPWALEI